MDTFSAPDTLRDGLLTLLASDPDIRQAVRDIVASPAVRVAPEPEPEPVAAPVDVAPPATVPAAPEPLRVELAPQLIVLATLAADPDLASTWLVDGDSEGLQLARLLASAAQWERLLELWDVLAERCKEAARPATAAELSILEGCLSIHNLIWRDRQAQVCSVEAGVEYDYRLHQRASLRGEVITQQWLPGLANAGGERQRLPLAATH
ncbi:hypothetical protein SAMN04487857_107203 [Pseudomonas sp. ok272]|uniref:hypothetical protein n=1 Tax=unclassified Pseudomonas TaxID=196821 RepID=UPI0008CBD5CB|nr:MULTISPECIES: hypothetical protein [unclassified Pseudomonas]SEM95597.1 hypothetical protein SAMN04487857_107203 [Pseudomonas sp. ok272]SFM92789.1 hypothetical protein SAMN04487858_10914 [Pseudomonas sp. ok602]